MAKALFLGSVTVLHLVAPRELVKEGRREDLRTIWESLARIGRWVVDDTDFYKQRGEEGWEALKQVLD